MCCDRLGITLPGLPRARKSRIGTAYVSLAQQSSVVHFWLWVFHNCLYPEVHRSKTAHCGRFVLRCRACTPYRHSLGNGQQGVILLLIKYVLTRYVYTTLLWHCLAGTCEMAPKGYRLSTLCQAHANVRFRFWSQRKVGQDEEQIKQVVVGVLAQVSSINIDGACVLVHTPDKADPRVVEGDKNAEQFLRALQYNLAKEVCHRGYILGALVCVSVREHVSSKDSACSHGAAVVVPCSSSPGC